MKKSKKDKAKPPQPFTPVPGIPRVEDGDLLGWFEKMAYEAGEHPLVLLSQPNVMRSAGIDATAVRSNKALLDAIIGHTFGPAYLWLRRQYRRAGIGYSTWSIELTPERWKSLSATGGVDLANGVEYRSPAVDNLEARRKDKPKFGALPPPGVANQEVEPPTAQHAEASPVLSRQERFRNEGVAPVLKPHTPLDNSTPKTPPGRKLERTVNGVPVTSEPGKKGGRKFFVFNYRTSELLRWCGQDAMTSEDVTKLLHRLGINVSADTVRAQMSSGRTGNGHYGPPAPVTENESKLLYALLDTEGKSCPAAPSTSGKTSTPKPDKLKSKPGTRNGGRKSGRGTIGGRKTSRPARAAAGSRTSSKPSLTKKTRKS